MLTVPSPAFVTYTCAGCIYEPRAKLTACGPAASCTGGPTVCELGSTGRMVLSASLTISSWPFEPLSGGVPRAPVGLPPSMVPFCALLFRLATARLLLLGAESAASTMSELGAAPTEPGARSSCTVVATAAAPIGTTDSEWSSWLAVTANSPCRGRALCMPPACCWPGAGVGAGAAGAPVNAGVAAALASWPGVAWAAPAGCGVAAVCDDVSVAAALVAAGVAAADGVPPAAGVLGVALHAVARIN